MQIKSLIHVIAICILFVGCNEKSVTPDTSSNSLYANIEFDMDPVQEPVIPDYSVSITDFGAKDGGFELNTQAFADAISAVSNKGGGKVIIPAGIWLTGPIILKSNLELHTENGALVVFSKNKDLYPLVKSSFEGLDTWRCISPIYGTDLENIAFTGNGVWDGSGDAWRFVKKGKLTDGQWKKLVKSGGVVNKKGNEWYPSQQYLDASNAAQMNVPKHLQTKEDFESIRDFLRPVMVSIQNSKRVMFDGPVFQNSPAWNIHPLVIEDLIVRNVTVRNPWYSQNGDGLDVESCKNVLVENCKFDVGDDAICIKSGKDEDGRRRGIPSENIVVKNNIVYHGHGGVTVGSEMSGGVKNMHVSNCTFIGTDVGLRFKSTRGRGGVVEGIYISNVRMIDIPSVAISFNLYYGGKSVSEAMEDGDFGGGSSELFSVSEETPQFKDIKISNVVVNGAEQAVLLQGLPEMNLENVELDNLVLKAKSGFMIVDANGLKITNVKLETENNKAIAIFNSKNIDISGFNFDFNATDAISINGADCESIQLKAEGVELAAYTQIGSGVSENVVKF